MITPVDFIEDGDSIPFGKASLQVLYTPGHADGSVCLVNHEEHYVIAGDVLFRDSIGRTDLPTGNFDVLYKSITTKLFTLPDDYIVFPGHGPETTIGYEKLNNPFLG
jgi:glyoxylase-like metal-dependent hydrolase (beta-lactamase superfamily II)